MSFPSINVDRFRARTSDLASFFRSLATPPVGYSTAPAESSETPYAWEHIRARIQQGGGHLEFFDSNLTGGAGAERVLKALERQPTTRTMNLASNAALGDDGLRLLLVGMKRLRQRAVGGQVQDLNLSGNGLSDVAFHLITLHLLTPSPHPTSITHLYLSNNKITLEPDLGHFLGIALSSPASSLACLSLTNNKRIGTPGLRSLLASLRLGPKSNLTQLHMSLCHITPDAAEVIASWLEDPAGGGTRLQAFCANGNFISSPGLRRIAHAVISGRCSGLLLLESLANEEGEEGEAEVWKDEIARLDEGEEEVEGWSSRLAKATERNKRVFKETRLAALGLLARARVLFAGNPHEPAVDVAEIRRGVEVMLASSQDLFLPSPPPPSGTFPFLRLPIEIQVHVLRASLLLTPSREAHLYPPLSAASSSTSPPPNHDTTLLSSPLTESQFLQLLSHAASRSTLATEIQIARAEATGGAPRVASLNGFQNGRKENFGAKSDEAKAGSAGGGMGWEEWVLRETGCDRFQRT